MNEREPIRKLNPARIVLVDDHPAVREGLAESINRESGLAVCGQADDRVAALRVIESTNPDLVVLDLTLKSSSGLELLKDIHARWPQVLILVVSMHDENLYAERVLHAGAQGYITKQEATNKVIHAIRHVLGGGIYLNERMSAAILARRSGQPESGTGSIADLLAERELEVFEMTGQGLSTREIAQQLHIDTKTVDTYRARIRQKLNIDTSSALLKLAIQWNRERNR
ncbi:MAG TPA: response regulator transcription factor [Verrucomicrobiae bacterium]